MIRYWQCTTAPFPGVFRDWSELSPDLKRSSALPEDMFGMQAAEYQAFHMTDPQVFYNREDLWVAPQEKYDGAVGRDGPLLHPHEASQEASILNT